MQLLKITGLALVGLCAVLGGYSMSLKLMQRVKALELALAVLDAISAELGYSLAPPDALIARLAQRDDFAQIPYLVQCDALCRGGTAFPQAWRCAVQEAHGYLTAQDARILEGLSQVLGQCGLAETLTGIARAQGFLETALCEARDVARERGKLYRTLGMLSGAFLIILLI